MGTSSYQVFCGSIAFKARIEFNGYTPILNTFLIDKKIEKRQGPYAFFYDK